MSWTLPRLDELEVFVEGDYIVIRQENGTDHGVDSKVYIPRERVDAVIEFLQEAKQSTAEDPIEDIDPDGDAFRGR